MINVLTTKEELKDLYDSSAMTWEGLDEECFDEALEVCGQPGAEGYLVKGEVMNDVCELTGDNCYPDDLNIFAIKDFKGLAINYGARWFDDIVANNDDREGRGYNYHNGESILD